ncbi:hypothetical protein CYMTET_46933 [Cymbomonas tetramitiformis]|uniref:Uncharacterized protein n=2 Tax=Cymbomonas tetramitiformis TaxID=36881 RepID=A0AAE0EWM2_9CHLO|nr:hypothetical protein CYMTET_46933 [Cymbomonas tetramitiformis]
MPGSGMMKPKKPIGYLQIESELTLSSSVVQAYLRNAPFYDAVDDELESDAENKEGDKFDPRILKRNISRLKYAVGGPPLLLYLCGFPQCGLLLPLHFYLCFAAGLWQLPLFFFGFVSVNSFLSYQGLKFDHLVIWEQDVGPEELKGMSKKFGMLMQTMGGIMKLTSIIANFFEQFANVWNFADVRVTTLALGGLGAFCLALSLILAIFPLRFIIFILGCGAIAAITMKGLKPVNAENSKAAPEVPPPVSNFFKRVPNNLEMAHRYIAMLQQQSGEKNNLKINKKS